MSLGFGVTSTIDVELVQRIASEVEAAGVDMFWSNDIPGGSSFDVLAACAGVTSQLRLANGIVPIDRLAPDQWKERIEEAGLMGDRYYAGIGSGKLEQPLGAIRDAIDVIRRETGRPVIVGALRTRMRRLAAEHADGVLLNWLTPEMANSRRHEMQSIRENAGNTEPFMCAAFVRVAIGDEAIGRLRNEANTYESYPNYRKHFDEMGVSALDTAVAAASVEEAAEGLVPFLTSLDHTVLRCVVEEEQVDAYLELVDAARIALARTTEA